MTDITVSFGSNTADLDAAFEAVKQQAQSFGGSIKTASDQGSDGLDKLTSALNANKTSWLDVAVGVVAANAAMALLKESAALVVGGLELAGRGAVAVWGAEAKTAITGASAGLKATGNAAISAAESFLQFSVRTLELDADVLGLGPSLIAAAANTDRLSTAVSNSSFTFEKFFRGIEIARSGVIDAAGAAIAAAGSMAQFEDSVKGAGFTSASSALRTFTGQLAEIPGTSDKVAADIAAMYATIPNANAHVIEVLVSLTQTLAKTGDEALAVGTKISEAFKGSATGPQDLAEILAKTKNSLDFRTLTNAFIEGLGDSAKSAELLQSVIKSTAVAQEEVVRHIREQVDWFDRAGVAGALLFGAAKSQINAEIDVNNELQRRLDLLNTVNSAQSSAGDLKSQIADANEIVGKQTLPSGQVTALQDDLDTLNDMKDAYDEMASKPLFSGTDKDNLAKINETIGILENRLLEARQRAQGIFGTIPGQLAIVKSSIEQLQTQIDKVKIELVTPETEAQLDGLNARMRTLLTTQQSLNDKQAGGTVYERESLALTISKNEALARQQLQPAFSAAAGATGVPQSLLEAVARQESGFDASKVSPTGAGGIMQILPSTAAQPGFGVSPLGGAPGEDSAKDIMFAAQYIKGLADKLHVDITSASGQAAVLTRYGGADQPQGDKNYVANVQRYNTGAAGGAGGPLDPLAQLEAQKKIDQQILDDATKAGTATVAMQAKVAGDTTAILNQQAERAKAAGAIEMANAEGDSAKKLELAKTTYAAIAAEQGKGSVAAQQAALSVISAQKAVDTQVQADQASLEDAKYQIALKGVAQRVSAIKEEAEQHKISAQQETAQLLQANDQRTGEEIRHQQALQGIYDQGTQQYREAAKKLLEIDSETALRRAKIEKETAAKIQQGYQSAFSSIGSNLDSSIMGIIEHTTTLRAAAKSATDNLISMFLQAGTKIVENWAVSMAKLAFPGGFSSIFSTLGIALPAFASGSWELPGDMIAQVHKGEMIVPADKASAIRDGSSPGMGGSAVHVHQATNMNVSTMDSRSFSDFAMGNRKTITRAVNEAVRTGAHLGLSKLRTK